jgi:hypothetical protein
LRRAPPTNRRLTGSPALILVPVIAGNDQEGGRGTAELSENNLDIDGFAWAERNGKETLGPLCEVTRWKK